MERLRTLVILTCLGAGSQIAFGESPDATSPSTQTEAPTTGAANPVESPPRPEPPAPPKAYLKAAAELFNKQRYDLAERYLAAAQMYRDRLTSQEQVVLDEYRDRLNRYFQEKKEAREAPALAAKAIDRGVVVASTVQPQVLDMSGKTPLASTSVVSEGQAPTSPEGAPPASVGPESTTNDRSPASPTERASTEAMRGTPDNKQKARWLLHKAREQIYRKQFDAAEQLAAEVRGMGIKWGYFDDTPEKVMESLTKARSKEGLATGAGANQPHDRRSARARLREARAALAADDVDKADAIVREVRLWDVRYGLLDDTPDKVATVTAEARRRAALRNAEMMVRSYVGSDSTTRGEPSAPVVPNPTANGLR